MVDFINLQRSLCSLVSITILATTWNEGDTFTQQWLYFDFNSSKQLGNLNIIDKYKDITSIILTEILRISRWAGQAYLGRVLGGYALI